MSAEMQSFIEVIERLPAGGQIRVFDVGWDDYEQLLSDLGEGYSVRVSFNDGVLEVMSPLPEHEEYKDIIHDLLRALVRGLKWRMESRGSATLRREAKAKGAEPDGCYWVQTADRMIGKRTLDLSIDPPPDIVVEIDLTYQSTDKFSIYASLQTPEIWRYDGRRMHFYRLEGEEYAEVASSRAFPFLTDAAMSNFVEQGKTQGQDEAIEAMQRWAESHRPE
ncbi:MAG: Uma2 family endonuclease [Acidobacteriota bacterium]